MVTISYPDGRLYELKMAGLWDPRRIWVRSQKVLIEYSRGSGIRRYAVVGFLEDDQETPLLTALGAYCLVMQDWDHAGAIGVMIAAIG
jgi:hypothetical protein